MIPVAVRDFILREFLPGDPVDALQPDTPLISSGIIDSVGTLKLVLFLEETYSIQIDSQDIAAGSLDSLRSLENLLRRKGLQV